MVCGDIKAVQGDSGHARAEMVQDVYSHILDEDRRANAQRFDENFYQKKEEPNQQPQTQSGEVSKGTGIEPEMLLKLFTNPEMAQAFQAFLATCQPKAANDN